MPVAGHFSTQQELQDKIRDRVQAHMQMRARQAQQAVQSLQSQLALTLGVATQR